MKEFSPWDEIRLLMGQQADVERADGDCQLVQKWWPGLGQAKATKAARKNAIVAIARQLVVNCWRWRTGWVTPQAWGWVRIGPPA